MSNFITKYTLTVLNLITLFNKMKYGIMKKALLIILLLKSSLIISQDFNDRIVTLSNDTILCQITFVNGNNIFYDVKIKKAIDHKFLALEKVKTYVLSKDSKADLSMKKSEVKDTPVKYDSLQFKRILLIQRSVIDTSSVCTEQRKFHVGNRIAIKLYSNDLCIKGRISGIGDSTMTIGANTILYKHIKEIHSLRGRDIFIFGGVSYILPLGISIALIARGVQQQSMGNEYAGDYFLGAMAVAFMGLTISSAIELFGIIYRITAKRYNLDKNYKIIVLT